jgi:hypothetical protein
VALRNFQRIQCTGMKLIHERVLVLTKIGHLAEVNVRVCKVNITYGLGFQKMLEVDHKMR